MLALVEAVWSWTPSWTWQTYFPLWATVARGKIRQERMFMADRTSVSGSTSVTLKSEGSDEDGTFCYHVIQQLDNEAS